MKNTIKGKKGISPIIATVLILGFTIVLAALFITWASGFFTKTQEETGTTIKVSAACTEISTNLKLTAAVKPSGPSNVLEVAVDNGASRDLSGFVFRVYNAGETVADSFDTSTGTGITTVPTGQNLDLNAQNIKTFQLAYDNTKITTPVKVGVKPKLLISGKEEICGENTREL